MTVITLSREYGSGGDEISQIICRETGYQIFDKELIAKAAAESGVAESGAIAFAESEYRVSSFIDRLLRRQAPAAEVRYWRESPQGVRTLETAQLDEDQVVNLVQQAVHAAYRRGNFVIVGRGGQAILHNLPGVLHVRVIATLDERILRVRGQPELTESVNHLLGVSATLYDIRLAAQDRIESRDAASQDYLRRNYGVNWNDPQLYDMTINTTRLSLETAAHTIIQAAQHLEGVRD